jgi:hypothetical protein
MTNNDELKKQFSELLDKQEQVKRKSRRALGNTICIPNESI